MIDNMVRHTALEDNYFGPLYIPPPSGSVDNSAEFWGGIKDTGSSIADAFKSFGTWAILMLILLIVFSLIWRTF